MPPSNNRYSLFQQKKHFSSSLQTNLKQKIISNLQQCQSRISYDSRIKQNNLLEKPNSFKKSNHQHTNTYTLSEYFMTEEGGYNNKYSKENDDNYEQYEYEQYPKPSQQQSLFHWCSYYLSHNPFPSSFIHIGSSRPQFPHDNSHKYKYFKLNILKINNVQFDLQNNIRRIQTSLNGNNNNNNNNNNINVNELNIYVQYTAAITKVENHGNFNKNVIEGQCNIVQSVHQNDKMYTSQLLKLQNFKKDKYEWNTLQQPISQSLSSQYLYFYCQNTQHNSNQSNNQTQSSIRLTFYLITIIKQQKKKSRKSTSCNVVHSKQSIGTVSINLDKYKSTMMNKNSIKSSKNKNNQQNNPREGQVYYFESKLEDYFGFKNQELAYYMANNQENTIRSSKNVKQSEYVQLQLIESDQYSCMGALFQPNKVYNLSTYDQISQISPGIQQILKPQNLCYQNIIFNNPIMLTVQIQKILLTQSMIYNTIKSCKQYIKTKYEPIYQKTKSRKNIQENEPQIQIKQYRMLIYVHNGETIISMSNVALKVMDSKNEQLSRIYGKMQKSKQKRQSSNNYNNRQQRLSTQKSMNSKNNRNQRSSITQSLELTSQSIGKLPLVFNIFGISIIFQIFSKVQIRNKQISPHSYSSSKLPKKHTSQTLFIPVSYCIKSIINMQNDVKYNQSLQYGEILNHNVMRQFMVGKNNKENMEEHGKQNKYNTKLSVIAQEMSKCYVQFYVFKSSMSAQCNHNHNNTMDNLQHQTQSFINSLSHVNILTHHHGQTNKIMLQKSRIQRERQKISLLKQKIQYQRNLNIPLLDPTNLKAQYYEERINKIKQRSINQKIPQDI